MHAEKSLGILYFVTVQNRTVGSYGPERVRNHTVPMPLVHRVRNVTVSLAVEIRRRYGTVAARHGCDTGTDTRPLQSQSLYFPLYKSRLERSPS